MISSRNIKQVSISLLEMIHQRIFGHRLEDEMRQFLKNLSWSFFGGIIASALMIGVNVAIGRYFGPEEYGKYNLVLILSQILLIFIYLGTDISSVKFISNAGNAQSKRAFLSSSFYFVVMMIILGWCCYFLIYLNIEQYFTIDSRYVFSALILGSALALKGITDGYLRSYSDFRFQALLRVVEAILITSGLIFVLSIHNVQGYQYYVYALFGGALLFSVTTLLRLRKNLGAFRWDAFKMMISYGNVILFGSIFGILFNSLDKIIVAKYLGILELGIYSAYFMTSTNIIAQITHLFNNAFFPAISQVSNTAYVEKINILTKWFFVPGGILISAFLYGVVLIFGAAYKPSIFLAVGFGFLSILQILFTINASIITALSKTLLKKYYLFLYIVSTLHIIAYGILIYFKMITILSLVLLFFLNFSMMILIQKRLIKSFILAKKP